MFGRLRPLLAATAKRVLPDWIVTPIIAERSRRHQKDVLNELGITEVSEEFVAKFGLTVRYGPFKGLKYTAAAARNRLIVPKLLGTYELDIQKFVYRIQQSEYDMIVDVGCAEGYYSTGFALTSSAQIVAFDAEKHELDFARAMAEHNAVQHKIKFGSWCTPQLLREVVSGSKRSCVLSDCEGYENTLFDPATISALRCSDLLIELHGDAKDILLPRFSATHSVEIISFVRRYDAEREELSGFSPKQRESAVDECRAPQEWLWAEAIQKP